MAREPRRPRLDQPGRVRRSLVPTPSYDPEAVGRFSERIARFLGTGRFLIYLTVFIVAWIAWNAAAPEEWRFDPYKFEVLTLALSIQASYAAPLILLAQNRQEDRDRVITEQDRQANARAHADMEFLAREMASLRMAIGEVATRDYVRSELRSLLQELDERSRQGDEEAEQRDDQRAEQRAEQRRETDDTRR